MFEILGAPFVFLVRKPFDFLKRTPFEFRVGVILLQRYPAVV
jgi:hypothetical protein